MRIFFVLGKAFDLCKAELLHILLLQNVSYSIYLEQPPVIILNIDSSDLNLDKLISILGGTYKIGIVLDQLPVVSAENLKPLININNSYLAFGFSNYASISLPLAKLSQELKDLLREKIAVRFVLPKNHELDTIVISEQKIQEYIFIFDSAKKLWCFGKTQVVHDAKKWTQRDYSRPFADPKSGMLPPKVARMLVNLASNQTLPTMNHEPRTILDPFCGMGTILGEALITGWQVYGSDVNAESVKKAQVNIEWLKKQYDINNTSEIFISDATHISEKIKPNAIDVIVTEPFMGPVFEKKGDVIFLKNKLLKKEEVKNIIRGLEKLYIGGLKDWLNVLKRNGKVVMVLPEIVFGKTTHFVKRVVDSCEKLGYTLTLGPLEYSRPQAIVKRRIYIFEKN